MSHITRRAFPLPASKPHYAPDRRARVDHIALKLSFDFARKILKGRCDTTFTAIGGPLKSFELQAGKMLIKGVRSGGKALPYELIGETLRIELPSLARGKSTTVSVDYEVRQPQQGIYFIGPDKGYPDKPYQVWTQGQDADAHYWFPCVDHPNAKATTEVTATVPSDYFVLSNGTLVSTDEDTAKKTRTYHWKMDVPHVTYLVSVVAGKFVGRTDSSNGVPVSWYVEPGREADGRRSFGKTPKMVKFFGDRIGVKYPYSKYAQIAVARFRLRRHGEHDVHDADRLDAARRARRHRLHERRARGARAGPSMVRRPADVQGLVARVAQRKLCDVLRRALQRVRSGARTSSPTSASSIKTCI